MNILGEIIQFPKEMIGSRVAVFSDGYVYVGSLSSSFPIAGGMTIHLQDAFVMPVATRPKQEEIMTLPDVFVRWEKVSAFAPAEHFQITYSEPPSEP